jgi:hypothetical protein
MTQLSKNAQKMLERLKAGSYYVWVPNKIPKAMLELQAAGLVGTCGRVNSIVRCWVPIGYRPHLPEYFPGSIDEATKTVLHRQAEYIDRLQTSKKNKETVKAGLLAIYKMMMTEGLEP